MGYVYGNMVLYFARESQNRSKKRLDSTRPSVHIPSAIDDEDRDSEVECHIIDPEYHTLECVDMHRTQEKKERQSSSNPSETLF